MLKQIVEENEVIEVNGVKCRVLSVGAHTVDGEPAGFSYSFRPVEDIEQDENVAAQAEERRQREEQEAVEARKAEIAAEQAEEARRSENDVIEGEVVESEETPVVESENNSEGSEQKTTQENSLPLN